MWTFSINWARRVGFIKSLVSGCPGCCIGDQPIIVGTIWGLAYAPADFRQGNSYRIIYVHVPASVVALAGYMLMAFAAAISLIWRMKLAEVVMKCAAPIGAGMAFISLVSGALGASLPGELTGSGMPD